MCLCWMLIAPWPYLSAQSRIEVVGTDTCAVVPIQQLRTVNVKLLQLKECKEENDSLSSQIRIYTGITNNLRESITDLKAANKLNWQIINDKQKEIDLSDTELKKEGRKSKILKLERNSVAVACLVLLAKIFVFK